MLRATTRVTLSYRVLRSIEFIESYRVLSIQCLRSVCCCIEPDLCGESKSSKKFRVLQEFYKSDWNKDFRFSKENIIKRKESVLYYQILDLIYETNHCYGSSSVVY